LPKSKDEDEPKLTESFSKDSTDSAKSSRVSLFKMSFSGISKLPTELGSSEQAMEIPKRTIKTIKIFIF
jgi:hypothetical protein